MTRQRSATSAGPTTAAGRALLEALPLDEWHPMNREFATDHILAIEAEAADDAVNAERRRILDSLPHEEWGDEMWWATINGPEVRVRAIVRDGAVRPGNEAAERAAPYRDALAALVAALDAEGDIDPDAINVAVEVALAAARRLVEP